MNSLVKWPGYAFDEWFDSWLPWTELKISKDHLSESYIEGDTGVIELNLAGYNKEEINAELSEKILTVTAEKKAEKKQGLGTNKVIKSFSISDAYDTEKCSISYKNGILKAVFPQKEEKKSKKITIKVE